MDACSPNCRGVDGPRAITVPATHLSGTERRGRKSRKGVGYLNHDGETAISVTCRTSYDEGVLRFHFDFHYLPHELRALAEDAEEAEDEEQPRERPARLHLIIVTTGGKGGGKKREKERDMSLHITRERTHACRLRRNIVLEAVASQRASAARLIYECATAPLRLHRHGAGP